MADAVAFDRWFKKSVWIAILVAITAAALFRARSVGTKEIEPAQTQSDAGDPRSAPKCGLVKVVSVALGGLCTASHQVPLDPLLARGIHDASTIRDAGVRRLRIGIDRDVLDALADLPSPALCHGTGLIPDQENGRRSGIRLLGVRDGTLLAFLGMQEGDRIETLEGFDMTESALAAYVHLCTAETERSPHQGREIWVSNHRMLNPWAGRPSKTHDGDLACLDDGLDQAA